MPDSPTITVSIDVAKLPEVQAYIDGRVGVVERRALDAEASLKAANDQLAAIAAADAARNAMKIKSVSLHTAAGVKPLTGPVVFDPVTGPFSLSVATEGNVASVTFDVNGKRHRTENSAPWTMFSDEGTVEKSILGTLPVGDYTIIIIPWAAKDAGGAAGTPATIYLRVAEPKPAPQAETPKPIIVKAILEAVGSGSVEYVDKDGKSIDAYLKITQA